MGNPRFYYYPDAAGSLEEIDLGEGLSDIQELEWADAEDAYTGEYVGYRSFLGAALPVRIVLERFGSPGSSALERKLKTLTSHLHKGGAVGFSRDHAKTWASVTSASPPNRGNTLLYTSGGNGFADWSTAGTVAAGDEIVIETPPPEHQREIAVCGSLTVTPPVHLPIASPGAVYTYTRPAVVRWRDFYPVMWLARDQLRRPIVTHDHRRNFTLDVTLEYNPAAVLALWAPQGGKDEAFSSRGNVSGPVFRDINAARGFGGVSLEEALQGSRVSRTPAKGR